MDRRRQPIVARMILSLVTWILALVILFEEWGWEPLARLAGAFARLPIFRSIEHRIASLPPYGALAVFFLPAATLFPIKLLALHAIASGHATMGVLVIIVAKVVGTAIVARLFSITQATLMRIGWFAIVYTKFITWKHWLIEYVHESTVWKSASALKRLARARWDNLKDTYFSHDNAS